MRIVAAAIVLVLFSCVTRAEEPVAPATSASHLRAPTERWYGYINLACDGAAVTTAVLATTSDNLRNSLGYGAVTTYLFGGVIAHVAHGNVGTGFASLGLRAGLPLASYVFGCMVGDGEGDLGCVIGLAAGVIAASAFDAAVLAYRTEASSYALRLMPIASLSGHGGTIGAAASF